MARFAYIQVIRAYVGYQQLIDRFKKTFMVLIIPSWYDVTIKEELSMVTTIWKKEETIMECVQCGGKFLFTKGERKYYKEHDSKIPCRCKSCRELNKKRKEKHDYDPYEGWSKFAPGMYTVEFKGGFDVTGAIYRGDSDTARDWRSY